MSDSDDPTENTRVVQIGSAAANAPERAIPEDVPYLIVLTGPRSGEMFRLDKSLTIGRDDDADIRLDDEAVSRNHARVVNGAVTVFLADLRSTNGTCLNGRPITDPVRLRDGDKISIGSTIILKFSYHDRLEEKFQQDLFRRARRDPLTGVWKRKYLDEHLRTEFAYARRHRQALSFIMVDVDHFKRVNDTWGHPVGDALLIAFARRVPSILGEDDFFGRYGGEEFAIVSRSRDRDHALELAERVRSVVDARPFALSPVAKPIPVTVSVGVAILPGFHKPSDLVAAADRALYNAKSSGRNRVVIAPSTESSE